MKLIRLLYDLRSKSQTWSGEKSAVRGPLQDALLGSCGLWVQLHLIQRQSLGVCGFARLDFYSGFHRHIL